MNWWRATGSILHLEHDATAAWVTATATFLTVIKKHGCRSASIHHFLVDLGPGGQGASTGETEEGKGKPLSLEQ